MFAVEDGYRGVLCTDSDRAAGGAVRQDRVAHLGRRRTGWPCGVREPRVVKVGERGQALASGWIDRPMIWTPPWSIGSETTSSC
jgi:hypothetical protein